MLKYLKGWYRTIRDSFKFVVFGDEKAYEALVAGANNKTGVAVVDKARVIKGTEGYALVVGKETVKTYARKSDAVRGAKRQGFAVIETA